MSEKQKKKSVAKASGLKATFRKEHNQYLMTSFGKGNTAQAEKHIENAFITDLAHTFSAEMKTDTLVGISKAANSTNVPLPINDHNQLQAKSEIEKIFFGKTFDDNIHIQIAYNAMDVKKILAVYANLIVYSVNNLMRTENESDDDFIGTLFTGNDLKKVDVAVALYKTKLVKSLYSKSKKGTKGNSKDIIIELDECVFKNPENRKLLSPLLEAAGYDSTSTKCFNLKRLSNAIIFTFGFKEKRNITKCAEAWKKIKRNAYYFSYIFPDEAKIDENRLYQTMRILSTLRQAASHSYELKPSKNGSFSFYTLENADDEIKQLLNDALEVRIKKLNNGFLKQNAVNLNILFSAYEHEDKGELVRRYYDFSIRKVFKNLGFSVKLLREAMLENISFMQKYREKQYDQVRSKLYTLLDFVIYRYYISNDNSAQELVEKLRAFPLSKADENYAEQKLKQIYIPEALKAWQGIEAIVCGHIDPAILECTDNKGIKNWQTPLDKALENQLKSVLLKPQGLHIFAKAIYVASSFLDGKEINMLLDRLINCFENLADLINCAKMMGLEVEFTPEQRLFESSASLAADLRIIKSIARMNKSKKAQKGVAININEKRYMDCAAVFGEYSLDVVKNKFNLEKTGKKDVHTVRNFFINNVIYSNRYNYVIRFISPLDAKKIMENEALVSFAIRELPQAQIARYFKATTDNAAQTDPGEEEMKKQLTERLLKLSFSELCKVSNSPSQAIEKERLKAIVGLYLTVLYLITKSLVRINTSYFIGISTQERDSTILQKKLDKYKDKDEYRCITTYFESNGKLNKRVKNLIDRNKACYNKEIFKFFRNNVAHLNVLSKLPKVATKDTAGEIKKVDSYFDLYHYLMLCCLNDKFEKIKKGDCEKVQKIIQQALPHQSACKDFLYGILAPLAYNPARYINLACKAKFLQSYGK